MEIRREKQTTGGRNADTFDYGCVIELTGSTDSSQKEFIGNLYMVTTSTPKRILNLRTGQARAFTNRDQFLEVKAYVVVEGYV